MALERTIHEALEETSPRSGRDAEKFKKGLIAAYFKEPKGYSIGKTIAYAIGGIIIGGAFSYIVFPLAPILSIFGILGVVAGVYAGHYSQLEKSVHSAEKKYAMTPRHA